MNAYTFLSSNGCSFLYIADYIELNWNPDAKETVE